MSNYNPFLPVSVFTVARAAIDLYDESTFEESDLCGDKDEPLGIIDNKSDAEENEKKSVASFMKLFDLELGAGKMMDVKDEAGPSTSLQDFSTTIPGYLKTMLGLIKLFDDDDKNKPAFETVKTNTDMVNAGSGNHKDKNGGEWVEVDPAGRNMTAVDVSGNDGRGCGTAVTVSGTEDKVIQNSRGQA